MSIAAVSLEAEFPETSLNLLTSLGELDDSVIELDEEKALLLALVHNLRPLLESTSIREDALAYLLAEKAALLASEHQPP